MVGNATLFGERNLGRTNIEMSIDLCGVANDDFAAQPLRERDSKGRFPGSSRSENDDEPRLIAHPENFPYGSKGTIGTSVVGGKSPHDLRSARLNED